MLKGPAAITLALVLGLARLAQAAGGRAPDQPLVVLTLAGQKDAEDASFFSSVRALAAELGIGVSTQEVPTFQAVREALLARARQESKPFLVAWIVRDPSTRTLHLFDPWENQLRTRTVAAGASAPANAETLALILRAELVAYLREPAAQPGPAPLAPPQPPVAPPPPAPPPVRAEPRWGVTIACAAGTFLRGQAPQRAARVGLWRRWTHVRVGAQYAWWPAGRVDAEAVTLTVGRQAVELDVGYASTEHRRLRVVAEAYVSGELVARHTSSATLPLIPQADDRRAGWAIGARGRAELRLARALIAFVALGAESPLHPHDLELERGTTETTVARPTPFSVIVELGLGGWFF